MNQAERTNRTRERIINAAVKLFGEKGYDGFTINSFCSENEIAKGLFYHNFAGKNDLYLRCVEKCYAELVAFLKRDCEIPDVQRYIERRLAFFQRYPAFARLFFESLNHADEEIFASVLEIRASLVALNQKVYAKLISSIQLREGVTETVAIEYFSLIQMLFNGYFSSSFFRGKDIRLITEDQEKNLAKVIDLVLYGIGSPPES